MPDSERREDAKTKTEYGETLKVSHEFLSYTAVIAIYQFNYRTKAIIKLVNLGQYHPGGWPRFEQHERWMPRISTLRCGKR